MTGKFQGNALPVLIGSLPVTDHKHALKLALTYSDKIPLWIQLPKLRKEGMIEQFVEGMPGLVEEKDKVYINTADEKNDALFLEYYEEYLGVIDGKFDIDNSRFRLNEDRSRGFFVFRDYLKTLSEPPLALKCQVTGPITFTTGLSDHNQKAIFYDDQLKDCAVKLLALKAKWQIKQLESFGCPIIVFFDEPALAGFGSSSFIGISREEVNCCLEEVIDSVHAQGALAGIHICANADWALILESSADIVSFDAYSFFDKFILYADSIKTFIDSGRIIAWGIVPTSNADDIKNETVDSLVAKIENQFHILENCDIDLLKIYSQSLITPSCGTGSLDIDSATRVLQLTKQVSDRVRNNIKMTNI